MDILINGKVVAAQPEDGKWYVGMVAANEEEKQQGMEWVGGEFGQYNAETNSFFRENWQTLDEPEIDLGSYDCIQAA